MPYAYQSGDNAAQELLIRWEDKWARDIVTDYDLFCFKVLGMGAGLQRFTSEPGHGRKLAWKLRIGKPTSYASAYPMPPTPAQPYQRRVQAELYFAPRSVHPGIPLEELDMLNSDSEYNGNLKSEEYADAEQALKEWLDYGFWNGTGNHLLGQLTGMDAAINDVLGTPVYAAQSAATFARWQANVHRGAWWIWLGNIATIILPLYVRSKGIHGKPDLMAVGMSSYSVMHWMMMDRQFSYKTNPKAADTGLGSQNIMLWNMVIEEGGDNMPGGPDTTQIFGINTKDIALRYLGRNLLITHDWKENYEENLLEALVRSHAQWQLGSREEHFRLFDGRIPDDPNENPGET